MRRNARAVRSARHDRKYILAATARTCLTILLAACTHAPLPQRPSHHVTRTSRSSELVISADEIAVWTTTAGKSQRDAYDLVAELRPRYVRGDGRSSVAQLAGHLPVVYLDRVRLGSVAELRQIRASEIAFIRFFSAIEARSEWGDGHHGGAIQVVRRR